MFHYIKRKVKLNKIIYLVIIKQNKIYHISINTNKNKRYIIFSSSALKVGIKIVKS